MMKALDMHLAGMLRRVLVVHVVAMVTMFVVHVVVIVRMFAVHLVRMVRLLEELTYRSVVVTLLVTP